MIMRYGGFGAAGFGEEMYEVRVLVKAPGVDPAVLLAEATKAAKSVEGAMEGAPTAETWWVVDPLSQGGWFLLRQMTATGRALPRPVVVNQARLQLIINVLAFIPGVTAVEADSVARAQDPGGRIPSDEFPIKGGPAEDPASSKSPITDASNSNTGLYLGIGAGVIAAYFLLRK